MLRFSKLLWLLLLIFFSSINVAQDAYSLQEASCRFQIPRRVDVDCYTLRLPENHNEVTSETIRLKIAILRHPSGNPEPDPIIFLQGGPGGRTLDNLHLTFENRFRPLFATNRDIIVFDQRGIGHSVPNLNCSTYQQTNIDLLDYEIDGNQLSKHEITAILDNLLIECAERLAESYDLTAYNSIQNAADIETIRQAFGYEQVNLWGVSYGTRLALTAMRDFPNSFRRVVLDSVYPLSANLYTETPVNFDRALNVLFDACLADADCNETYPNLETVFFETVERLNQDPVRLNAPNPYDGSVFEDVLFDGNFMLRTTFQLLYSTSLLPRLPELIYAASDGDIRQWSSLIGWIAGQRSSYSVGMNYAVQCQEEFFFTDVDDMAAAWDLFPNLAPYSNLFQTAPRLQTICAAFEAGESPISENQAVTDSGIPSLILSGEYDPVTPPRWAANVAENFDNSMYFNFPATGHGVSGSGDCAQSMLIDFFMIDDIQTLESSCIAELEITFSGTQRGDFVSPDSAGASSGVRLMN